MSITHKVSDDGRQVEIRVAGRFDFSSHQAFRNAYSEVEPTKVSFVIDLSQTEYLDSAALGMLLVLRERAGGIARTSCSRAAIPPYSRSWISRASSGCLPSRNRRFNHDDFSYGVFRT